jgi:hypothetical protein
MTYGTTAVGEHAGASTQSTVAARGHHRCEVEASHAGRSLWSERSGAGDARRAAVDEFLLARPARPGFTGPKHAFSSSPTRCRSLTFTTASRLCSTLCTPADPTHTDAGGDGASLHMRLPVSGQSARRAHRSGNGTPPGCRPTPRPAGGVGSARRFTDRGSPPETSGAMTRPSPASQVVQTTVAAQGWVPKLASYDPSWH